MDVWKIFEHNVFGNIYEVSDLGNVRRIGNTKNLKPKPLIRHGRLCDIRVNLSKRLTENLE